MSNFIKTQGEVKNKKGKVIENYMNFQPKKGYVHIKDINDMYNKVRTQIDPKKIMIKIQTKTGFLTAKSYGHIDDDLELLLDNYYSTLSKEGQDKFKDLLSFQIIMMNY